MKLRCWYIYIYISCLLAGQRFALREGGRTVGAGVVSKVISWNPEIQSTVF